MSFLRAVSIALVVSLPSLAGCAKSACAFNSDCEMGLCVSGECVVECRVNIDCKKGESCVRGSCQVVDDAGADGGADVSLDGATVDTGASVDTGVEDTTIVDTGAVDTATDTGGGGTKSYLTGCAVDGDCASGHCAIGTPRFCTKTCAAHADCANGQLCAGGLCALDDSGKTGCDLATGAPCKEYCFGSSTVSTGRHCTHACSSASECPSGFACSSVSGKKICVDIERPCTDAAQCPSGLGFCTSGGLGCTARCDTASDCPLRLVGLPAYTCEDRGGTKVCVPPSDVLGSDALGTTCTSTGTNLCRSGACDDGVSPSTCNQRCSVVGGCPTGWGCFPLEDPGPPKTTMLVCTRATGSAWLGDACSRGSDCVTGICQSPGYCTRLCVDGLCPDSMSCVAAPLTATDGTPIKLCTKA